MITYDENGWPIFEVKKPSAVLDYALNWADWLASHRDDDLLDTNNIVITPDRGITIPSESHTDIETRFWVSGGSVGNLYRISVKIITINGRTEEWFCWLPVDITQETSS